ncbi:hypothetical protein QQX09_04195 [Demequina sp. SYSU T00192]|uniref:Leucine rich repeat variant n=1 Tax=Demequina litoralis TaxID=3051660 RepID=A0ABT8G7T1_9MICO|nr:hypothetical protein [Demequina sp. SYSU T00192]MDN4475057.1 hypothetical protein [Demequina sp. SYSU T00192]
MARGFSYAPGASTEVEEAAAPGLTKERMQELGGSRNALVREAIAARTDCPFGLMVTLAHDHVVPVRAAMAGNPKVLHSILDYLSHDRQVAVLCAVAGNPSTGQDILEALAAHRKGAVRDAAAAALDARAGSAVSADHTPELRDRVFEESQARREALLAEAADSSLEAAADAAMEGAAPVAEPAEPLPARPTRSAPVRGFRPPVDA